MYEDFLGKHIAGSKDFSHNKLSHLSNNVSVTAYAFAASISSA